MKEPEVKADKMENEAHSKQFISVVNLKKNVKQQGHLYELSV